MIQDEQAVEQRRGAVLIVSGDPGDRDRLCAVLDALEFDAIYAVSDVVQARLVLGQIARLHLVLLALSGDDRVATTFCTELRQAAPLDPPAILALIRPDALAAASGRGYLSGGLVTDWIASPVVPEEALARVATVLDGRAAHAGAPRAAGERYRFAFDDSHEELLIVDVESGRVVDANPAFLLRSGHARVQVVGARAETFDGFVSVESRLESLNRLAGEGRARYAGYRQRADASRYPVDAEVHLALSAGRPVHVYTFRDPGDLGRYRLAMSTLSAIHRTAGGELAVQQILRHAMDWLECDWGVVAMLCPESSEFTRVVAADDRALPFGLVESSDREPLLRLLVEGDDLLEGSEAWRVVPAESLLRARQYECLIGFPLRDERGGVVGAWVMARALPLEIDSLVRDSLQIIATRIGLDLEVRQAREQGRARGLRDALTGLPNRLLFSDRLDSTLKQAHRTGESFALLFVELDPLHIHGGAAAPVSSDRVLPVAAQRLRACVRAYDTVARYSGCEFVVILRHIVKREDALRIAEKIVRAMDAPVPVEGGHGHRIRTTIGLSFHPDDAIAADRLLLHAEEAMQAAKSMGHSNYQAYVLVPEESQRQRLALEQKLRRAERNGELRVYYQPQIDGRTEDIVGMEALIRWENPELGMISPGFFIPLAEQTGLIVSLGQWVLRAACADARRWQARFDLPLRVSVNLSALQLRQADLVERIAAILAETGLDPRSLDLEVTESISLKAIPNLLDTLQALREIGCRTSIDDFGTGQSSLDYIKRFPADSIKIDQAFVRNIGVDPDDEAIVRATIDMAHSLGRTLVAEGVEVERHVDFLRAHGCDVLQGYLFCRPVPAPAFEAMLLERERVFRRIAEPSGAP